MTSETFPKAAIGRLTRYWSAMKRLVTTKFAGSDSHADELKELKDLVRSLNCEFTTQLSFVSHDLMNEFNSQFQSLSQSVARMEELSIATQKDAISRTIGTESAVATSIGQILSRINAIETKSFESTNKIIGRLNEVDNRVFEGTNQILGRQNALDNRLVEISNLANALDSKVFEGTNQVLGRQNALDNRLAEISNMTSETSNLVQHVSGNTSSRFNEILNQHLPAIMEQVHEAAALQIRAEVKGSKDLDLPQVRPSPVGLTPMDAVLERAAKNYPEVYEAWFERYETLRAAMARTKVGNAAHGGDTYSRLFKAFLERHAQGALLDVGCGPYGCPYYLEDYAPELVIGIDPMPNEDYEDQVSLVRGISEFLPFGDGVFGTVVSGTSLDHCLSLERSLDEMTRVLAPSGIILLWLGSVPGAPEFAPNAPDYEPVDQFHLFHFDISWFEPMLEERFQIIERIKLERAGYAHVFYALTPFRTSSNPKIDPVENGEPFEFDGKETSVGKGKQVSRSKL